MKRRELEDKSLFPEVIKQCPHSHMFPLWSRTSHALARMSCGKELWSSVHWVLSWHCYYKSKNSFLEFPILPWGNDLLSFHNYDPRASVMSVKLWSGEQTPRTFLYHNLSLGFFISKAPGVGRHLQGLDTSLGRPRRLSHWAFIYLFFIL